MTFTRKPVFWILHFLFFIACVLYAWKNFNRAFPFVDIQIKMDRKTALEKAAQLASDHGLFPKQGYLKAVTFQIDSPTQNFIELEAGGPRSLKSILKEGVYTPYTWQVRHFAQGQTNESRLSFTPDGTLYGLWEKISEDDPGAALDAAQARKLAESSAQGSWAVDLKPYHLVEQASQTRKSGRVDHSFIYERGQVGDGKYRLKLSLSGNRLSEISRFIQVPDAFFRRFEAMRSANSTVSSLAGAVIVLLYGLGFCGFGLFTLARRHAVLWRRPAALAAFISLLQFLDHLNRLPLEWMDYDTAISTQAFVVRLVTNWLLEAIFDFIIVVIPLLAGESLSRLAFADHPQLWRVFTGDAAGSRQIFGRILGAYLLVGLNFAWAAWIYIVGSQRLGWWNPSELLFHPDELATYFPWLTSIANSLHAGIWEECLFRAVPLAGAALLGNRFGRRAAWIAGAFILQMLVFGAAHADYPAQPSYARLVELLVPSSLFGGMYLLFGLLPAMLMHFTYDVTLFAMPLFLSSGRTAVISRIIVVGASGLPLWVSLAARLRAGAWRDLPAQFYNRDWKPKPAAAEAPVHLPPPSLATLTPSMRKWLPFSGLIALAIWAAFASFHTDAPGLKLGRKDAVALARKALDQQHVALGPQWQALPLALGGPADDDLFVWRTSGPAVYGNLLNNYLEPPHWMVRFVRFEGDLTDRTEEWQVFILGSGEVERIRHELPESRPGAILEEPAAHALADRALRQHFKIPAMALQPVESHQFQLPARRDWVFTWKDANSMLKRGEARVAIKIAGDEVVGYRQYVQIPEDWLRGERARQTVMNIIKALSAALLASLVIWIWFLIFRDWILGRFDQRVFFKAFAALVGSGFLLRLNNFKAAVAHFSTAQPWATQALSAVISGTLLTLLGSALFAMCLGRVHASRDPLIPRSGLNPWIGYGCGTSLAALSAVTAWLSRAQSPSWPALAGASAYYPPLEFLSGLTAYLCITAIMMLLFSLVERRFPRGLKKIALFAAMGLAMASLWTDSSLVEWLGASVVATLGLYLIYQLVAHTSAAILAPLMAGLAIVGQVRTLLIHPYCGARLESLLLIAGIAVVSWIWHGKLDRQPK